MSLARAQQDFLDAILGAREPDDPRVAVYHRNALAARRGALSGAYPVVRRLVGEAFFDAAAEAFATRTPSASGDLHAYGAGFAGFLRGYAPAAELECLPDVARLEWAVHESHHASDGAPFDFAALGRLPPESLGRVRIGLHPAVRLVASTHPVLAIWEANQDGQDGTPERADGADRVLVRRRGQVVAPVRVEPGEWALLEALARGEGLDEAAAATERAGGSLEAALARLAELDALGGFESGPGG
jgi:hypothetical protein